MEATKQDSIDLNNLFTDEAYREFLDSKLYYTDKLAEEPSTFQKEAEKMEEELEKMRTNGDWKNIPEIESKIKISKERAAKYTTLPDQLKFYASPDALKENPNYYTDYLNILLEQRKLSVDEVIDNIDQLLITIITMSLRPLLYKVIKMLNEKMEEYGKFIISGGEAFNLNVEKKDRKLTPDIDTKFILYFGKQIPEKEDDYAGIMLKLKEYFWFKVLEEVLQFLHNEYEKIYNDILKPLENCTELKLFSLTFMEPNNPEKSINPFKKRLTLIPKNRENNMFFDLNLFAIDLFVKRYKYFKPIPGTDKVLTTGKIEFNQGRSIHGVLDLPFMRPGHLGYEIGEVGNSTVINVHTSSKPEEIPAITSCLTSYSPYPFVGEILAASKVFLKEDINKMLALGLREGKQKKDQKRLDVLEEMEKSGNAEVKPIKPLPILTEFKTPDNIDTKSFDDTFISKDNLNPISVGKVLKLIAPPTVYIDDKLIQKGVFDIFEVIKKPFESVEYEKMNPPKIEYYWIKEPSELPNPPPVETLVTLSQKQYLAQKYALTEEQVIQTLLEKNFIRREIIEEYVSEDTARRFLSKLSFDALTDNGTLDYISKQQWRKIIIQINTIMAQTTSGDRFDMRERKWIDNCCEITPKDKTCCDPIGNQFRFRINTAELGFWLFSGSEEFKKMTNTILSDLLDYLKNIDIDDPEAKNKLGLLLYDYNPNYAEDIDIVALISNILITVQNLRWANEYEEIVRQIWDKLLELRMYALHKQLRNTRDITSSLVSVKKFREKKSFGVETLETIILPHTEAIYKAMLIPDSIAKKYDDISFYTLNIAIAQDYLKMSDDANWALFECVFDKDINLIDLSNPNNLELLTSGETAIVTTQEDKDALAFIFGYKMSSKEQYDKFKYYNSIMGAKSYGLIPGLTEESLATDDQDIIKRCSIYNIDRDLLQTICNKIKQVGSKSTIDGFYIPEGLITNYCATGSKICDDRVWHDEVILCDSSNIKCRNKALEELEKLLMKQDKKGVKRDLDDPEEEQKRNKANMDEELIEEEAKILYDDYLQKDYNNEDALVLMHVYLDARKVKQYSHEDALIFVEAYLEARKINQYTSDQALSFAEAYLRGINNKGLNEIQAKHYAHQIVAGFSDETAIKNAKAMP